MTHVPPFPRKPEPAPRKVVATFRCPVELKRELESVGDEEGKDFAEVCRHFLQAALAEWRKTHPKK